MKKYIGLTSLLLLSSCPNLAPAETPCNYEHLINSSYIYTIQNTKDFKKEVFPYVDDTRKCVISMWVTIKDKTYPAQGSYVFGPDMSEMQACEFAEKKAKEQVIREVSPVKLSSNTDLSCIKKDVVTPEKEVVVSSKVVEVRPVCLSYRFETIQQTYSSDPTTITTVIMTINHYLAVNIVISIRGYVMFKFIFGIAVGIILVTYYPEITTVTTDWFIDSGVRDDVVETLEGMK